MNAALDVSGPVAAALDAGKGVVALESTIITHGMPFPQNLEMAMQVEADIAAEGAVPATVAIMDGRLKAGLDANDLEKLARTGGVAAKASRRDIAGLISSGGVAGTTVATTMLIAHWAGISLFATGGIGGVHRGAEESFDVSADLDELSRTPVAVVCAGAKSILDIPKTLEVLETRGVPVVGYGTDVFPAFYLRDSGHAVSISVADAEEAASLLDAQFGLRLGGALIANPIDKADEPDASLVAAWISAAEADAVREGIKGKDVTPFLLQRIFEISDGESLKANIALVRNNARVAARIAVALAARSNG